MSCSPDQTAKKDPSLRTVAMPGDANPSGDIFGGWIMSQMDIAGAIMAKEVARGRVVTVAAESIVFHKPVKVGDVVCCYGQLIRVGKSSISINLEIWVKPILRETEERCPKFKVTDAKFTYVAVDESGKKRMVPKE